MKKAIREWAFNLFTKRITIKITKLPDNERIEFLANKLMDELISQGHDICGSPGRCSEFFSLFGHGNKFEISSSIGETSVSLNLNRTK